MGRGGGGQPEPQAKDDAPEHVVVNGRRYPLNQQEIMELLAGGHGRSALAAYESAAADAEKRGAKVDIVMTHGAVAFAAVRLGMPQKALRFGARVLEVVKDVPMSPTIGRMTTTAYSVMASAYRHAGDLAQARTVIEQGVAFARALPGRRDSSVALLSATLSVIALAQGDERAALAAASEAFKLSEQALAALPFQAPERIKVHFRRQAANALVTIGRTHMQAKRLDEADAALGKARSYARLTGLTEMESEVIGVTATLKQSRNDHAAALALYEEGLAIARKLNRVQAVMVMSQGASRSYAALGRVPEALAAAKDAIKLTEEVRSELTDTSLRTGYLDDKQVLYQAAARLALRLGRTDEAFVFAESSRARAFLDLLGNQATLSKGTTKSFVDEEIRLRARLEEARAVAREHDDDDDRTRSQAGLAAAERDYRAFLDRVRKENVEQASLMSVEPVTLAEIQALLPEGTTLLEYLVGDQDVIVWIVDRSRAQALRVPADRAALVADVRAFRGAIADQADLAQVQDRAVALYRTLIETARPHVRGDRLLIVPHDVLHYLPFAALRSPEGRWLVEEFALATLPSASVLKFLAGKGKDASVKSLAIGNPDVGAGLNLRWAEREAKLVGQRLGDTTVLVRGQATEARAKELVGGVGLVHFATHGELNEADPLGSALLLSPGAPDDGRLEVRELFTLELHARLVVLSACETGLGKLSRGDELVGLQRAFLYAGTPAVVTTLWKVDDRASFDLVRAFYDRFAADGAVQALRQAQIKTMGAYPHPFAWAAFGLTGAPQ